MTNSSGDSLQNNLPATPDDLLAANRERGDGGYDTGRVIVTFKAGAWEDGVQSLSATGVRVADARDYDGQVVASNALEQADALALPHVRAAILSGSAAGAQGITAQSEPGTDSPIEAIEAERFAFASGPAPRPAWLAPAAADSYSEYLRGFAQAAETIARNLSGGSQQVIETEEQQVLVLGATWGLLACRVPQSAQTGGGINVAVLDTGVDLSHPDLTSRQVASETFVGQPVQDLHSHGTHCIGTACGPFDPLDNNPRYGVAYRASISAGKVLSNSGNGTTGAILAGINWAIANRYEVISMSLGGRSSVQAAYTAAGEAALNNNLLIVAAAGNEAVQTYAPANSPTILAVSSLDPTGLAPSSFSNFGKIDIAAPGRDVFSAVPMPQRYGTKSGTSMATPHVAGCAALWAQTSPSLRGMDLWKKLQDTAKPLPYPASRIGAGLVQAP